jgi:hypothetical protein
MTDVKKQESGDTPTPRTAHIKSDIEAYKAWLKQWAFDGDLETWLAACAHMRNGELSAANAEIVKVNGFRESLSATHRMVRDQKDQAVQLCHELKEANDFLRARVAELEQALHRIARLGTHQTASPTQCEAVLIAMNALSPVTDSACYGQRPRQHGGEMNLTESHRAADKGTPHTPPEVEQIHSTFSST